MSDNLFVIPQKKHLVYWLCKHKIYQVLNGGSLKNS